MCDSMKSLFSIEQFGAQAATEISAAMELLHEEKMKNIALLRELYAIQRPELDMKIHELYLQEQERPSQAAFSSVNDNNSPPVSPQSTKTSWMLQKFCLPHKSYKYYHFLENIWQTREQPWGTYNIRGTVYLRT